jgi:hypothetical protein
MDAAVLPGPSLAERARTAIARARLATVTCRETDEPVTATAWMRAGPAGQPVLLLAPRSAIARRVAIWPAVTVTVPALPPFPALALTGTVQPGRADEGDRARHGHRVVVDSLRFTGPGGPPVPLVQYQAAAPDPLWKVAPAILRHLQQGHMAELVSCMRAHGLRLADWVVPRGLDRFGLELAVLAPHGVAAVRLSFPDGPVTSLEEVPGSLRAVLTCRCRKSDPRGGREPGM